jgi:hypothetical protein
MVALDELNKNVGFVNHHKRIKNKYKVFSFYKSFEEFVSN